MNVLVTGGNGRFAQELKKINANTSLVLVGEFGINELEKLIDQKINTNDIKIS